MVSLNLNASAQGDLHMARWLLATAGTLLLVVCTAAADERAQGGKNYLGTWKRTAGDNTITFEVKPQVLRILVTANGNTIEAEADYATTKDGVLFGRISKVIKKGTDDGPSEGDLFSFKLTHEKGSVNLSDLKGTGPNENPEVKQLVEGEYRKEKDEK
jgi:hypothetical protein